MRKRLSGAFLLVATLAAAQVPRIDFDATSIENFPVASTYTDMIAAALVGSAHPDVVLLDKTASIRIVDLYAPGGIVVTTVSVFGVPRFAEAGDLDGDGDHDLAVVGRLAGSPAVEKVSMLLQNAGTFTRQDYALGGVSAPVHIRDINGDGIADILTGKNYFLGSGGGAFGSAFAISAGSQAVLKDVVPGDFDGDGDIDFCIGYLGGTSQGSGAAIRFVRKNAGGTYTALAGTLLVSDSSIPQSSTVPADFGFAATDMNQDGIDDVVLGWFDSAGLRNVGTFLLGSGFSMTATAPAKSFGVNSAAFAFASIDLALKAADLDGDGFKDVVLRTYSGGFLPSAVLNDGTGALVHFRGSGFAELTALSPFDAFTIADFDLDGDVDLAWRPHPDSTTEESKLYLAGNTSNESPSPTLTVDATTPRSYLIPNTTPALDTIVIHARVLSTRPGEASFPVGGKALDVEVVADGVVVPSGVPFPNISAPLQTDHLGRNLRSFTVPETTIVTEYRYTVPDGEVLTTHAYRNHSISIVSGNNQTFCYGVPLAPFVVRVLDANGAPIEDADIIFSTSNITAIELPPGPLLPIVRTDAAGYAQFTPVAGLAAGNATLIVGGFSPYSSASGDVYVAFHVTNLGAGEAQISGADQAASLGTEFPNAIAARIVDCNGNIQVGVPVTFTTTSGPQITFSPSTAITDSSGIATVTATASTTETGFSVITVTTPLPTVPSTTFSLFSRGLITGQNSNWLWVNYAHEHAGATLLFAVDTLLPAPGFLTTPLGNVATSVLSPGPDLVVLDGFGLFGPVDPGMMTFFAVSATNPFNWGRTYPAPPAIGMSFVLQMYGYDPAYPGLDGYFISNAVILNL